MDGQCLLIKGAERWSMSEFELKLIDEHCVMSHVRFSFHTGHDRTQFSFKGQYQEKYKDLKQRIQVDLF